MAAEHHKRFRHRLLPAFGPRRAVTANNRLGYLVAGLLLALVAGLAYVLGAEASSLADRNAQRSTFNSEQLRAVEDQVQDNKNRICSVMQVLGSITPPGDSNREILRNEYRTQDCPDALPEYRR